MSEADGQQLPPGWAGAAIEDLFWLMTLLTAVDQDVEIVIRKKPRTRRADRISVVAA